MPPAVTSALANPPRAADLNRHVLDVVNQPAAIDFADFGRFACGSSWAALNITSTSRLGSTGGSRSVKRCQEQLLAGGG